jgi:cell wall-associated NlpC family hydrolase
VTFFTDYLSDAQKAASDCKGMLVSVILAQWSDETGGGGTLTKGPDTWNFAGVTNPKTGKLYAYNTEEDGLTGYIDCLNQSIYDSVRSASEDQSTPKWEAQCVALGKSPWAAAHYNAKAYNAGLPESTILANAGVDLIDIILSNALTQYDGASTNNPAAGSSGTTVSPGATIGAPPLGFASNVANGDIIINGQTLDVNVQNALVTAGVDLSISQASTFTLTLNDPDRIIIQSAIFTQTSIVTLGSLIGQSFQLVSVDKEQSVITATFEAYVVAALRTATGAFTVGPGVLSRTEFAKKLVGQIDGATFAQASVSYLKSIGYDTNTKEQLSRGTSDTPLEDSWTCLQRLASEIQWVCYEYFGTVYFGPYTYLTYVSPVMQPVEWSGGIDTIDGTYNVNAPQTTLEITAKADSWFPGIGACILIQNLGPFNGNWLVSEMERDDITEPDITITIMQPLAHLPEPTTGGATAAVGSGTTSVTAPQSPGGQTAAQGAVAFCVKQLGKPYIYGATGPAGFDCSGLVQAGYAAVGIPIPRTTSEEWGAGITKVPAGISNLKAGDLVYFQGGDPPPPGHVAIVTKTNKATNIVTVIDAYETGDPIRYDTFTYVNPGGNTSFAGKYFGALRPAT